MAQLRVNPVKRAGYPISLSITILGDTFADATILGRKEIFATRICRLPFIRRLLAMLKAADRQRLELDVLLTALELEFPNEEAERQMETLANWGLYAEIFAYNDDDDVFFLELDGSRA